MKNSLGTAAILCLLFLSSCSLSGSDDKQAEAQFRVHQNLIETNTLSLHIIDGKRSYQLENSDFEGEHQELSAPAIETSTSGELVNHIELTDSQINEMISSGDFRFDLRNDWRYGTLFKADSVEADPAFGCFGCLGYRSFEIDPVTSESGSNFENDSLYVVWGGNFINNPVVY